MKKIIIIFTFFICILANAQEMLVPGQGIKNDSIKVNVTPIGKALQRYGQNFEKTEGPYFITYCYKQTGISFSTYQTDKNQIIRRITFQYPYKAGTDNGTVLNQTTAKDFNKKYDFKSFKGDDRSYFQGITYCIRKKENQKYSNNDTIYKIEIADDENDQLNYAYNKAAEIQGVGQAVTFIKTNLYADTLTEYFKNKLHQPFVPQQTHISQRLIQQNVLQSVMQLKLGKSSFNLDLLSRNDTIFYLKIATRNDSAIINYRDKKILTEYINRHNAFYETNIDTLNENEYIAQQFIYGTVCGIAGMPPQKRMELYRIESNKNYATAARWLRSPNPEIQAYGLRGMYELSKTGVKLSAKDLELMEYLVSSPVQLYACSDCLTGVDKKYADIVTPATIKKLKKQASMVSLR